MKHEVLRFVSSLLRGRGTVSAFAQTLATQILVLALNVATGVLTARMLGPDGRGIFSAITFWPFFLSTLAMLGLQNALVFHIRKFPSRANGILTAGLSLGAMLGFAGALIGVFLVFLAMKEAYSPAVVKFTMFATGIVTVVNLMTVLLRSIFLASERIGTTNKSAWAIPLLYLILLLIAWRAFEMTAEVAAFCQFFSATLILIWMITELAKFYRPSILSLRNDIKALSSYTVRIAPGEALSVLASNLDRLVLVPVVPPDQLGYYAVAFSLSRLLIILQTALGSVALPAMAGRSHDEAKALHDRLFRFSVYAVLAISLGTWLFGDWALQIFYGKDFAAAGSLFKILVAEAGIGCLSFLVSQLYMTMARPGFLSVVQAASFLFTLLSLAVLVPRYASLGAALAMLISTIFRFFILLWGVRATLGLRLPRMRIDRADFARILDGFKH